MKVWHGFPSGGKNKRGYAKNAVVVAMGILSVVLAVMGAAPAASNPQNAPTSMRLADAPEKIYSDNPNDSWNRIFYYLFSRWVTARMSADFPEAGPFERISEIEFMHLEKSTGTFEREETGDRPIDPLYPSFLSDEGARFVLKDPVYGDFKKAIQDGLADTSAHEPVARAVMQNDLWSAYDIIFRCQTCERRRETKLPQRRLEALDLLGRLIRKMALTPEEIRALPDNYAITRAKNPLPDLFANSGWVEVRWFPNRLQDEAVDYRRVTRVFLKPARQPRNMQKFLDDLRPEGQDQSARLDGVALLIQPLVIDTLGEVKPTTIASDMQIRMFEKNSQSAVDKTAFGIYEINRKLLRDARSGFLAGVSGDAPAYLPSGGNDYTFVSTIGLTRPEPLAVKQRTRCSFCHGEDLRVLLSFAMKMPTEERPGPPVRQLNPASHEAADFVISQKTRSAGWKALQRNFVN
jgi:hypothetical protein